MWFQSASKQLQFSLYADQNLISYDFLQWCLSQIRVGAIQKGFGANSLGSKILEECGILFNLYLSPKLDYICGLNILVKAGNLGDLRAK